MAENRDTTVQMGSQFEMGEKGELEHLTIDENAPQIVKNEKFEMGEKGELAIKDLKIRTVRHPYVRQF